MAEPIVGPVTAAVTASAPVCRNSLRLMIALRAMTSRVDPSGAFQVKRLSHAIQSWAMALTSDTGARHYGIVAALAALVAVTVLALRIEGRRWWCACGQLLT